MTTAELVTVTVDPGLGVIGPEGRLGAAVQTLIRLLEGEGLPVRGYREVGAEEGAVERALREAAAGGGLVLALGDGEGAEVLRQALARLLGSRLVLSERVLDGLAAAYAARERAMPRRAEALALIPQGATLLVPAARGEPGLLVESGGAVIAALPGAPGPAAELTREQVLPRLRPRAADSRLVVRTLRLVGVDPATVESRLQVALAEAGGVGFRVVGMTGEVWARLRVTAVSPAAADARLRELRPLLGAQLGADWYGSEDETLEAVTGRLLRARGLTVSLAESCTGGLVGHRLTQVPGSSAYFERGVVVYSNAAKQALLGVPAELLARHGAVSAPCVEAMARGIREQSRTALGLAVTGIAGPEGGTPAKPVGTVFVGLADARGAVSRQHRFDRDRDGNKALSATAALDALRRYCLEA